MIGISSLKAIAADGVSFAIPIATAVEVVAQLKAHGRVIRPYIGIKMLPLNPSVATQLRRRDPAFPNVSSGILVPHVTPGSPAQKAGLRPGDVIIGGLPCLALLGSIHGFEFAWDSHAPGMEPYDRHQQLQCMHRSNKECCGLCRRCGAERECPHDGQPHQGAGEHINRGLELQVQRPSGRVTLEVAAAEAAA